MTLQELIKSSHPGVRFNAEFYGNFRIVEMSEGIRLDNPLRLPVMNDSRTRVSTMPADTKVTVIPEDRMR